MAGAMFGVIVYVIRKAIIIKVISIIVNAMNGPSYFEIQADDTARASCFYQEVFGWQLTQDKHLSVEYWRIKTQGPAGGLLKRPAKIPGSEQGTNAFVCSMEVKDFDIVALKIVKLGGQVALPKFAVPGKCWQGYFLDTEGNTFGIYQVDSKAK